MGHISMRIRRSSLSLCLLALYLVPASGRAEMLPFSAAGPIEAISPGTVDPAGASGRFVVEERQVSGWTSGDVAGTFVLTYAANVPIATQSGQLHGTVELGSGAYAARFRARSELGLTPVPCGVPDARTCIATPDGAFRPGLLVNGSLTFVDGTQGHGLLSAWLIPQIGPDGHIQGVIAGALSIGGSWAGQR